MFQHFNFICCWNVSVSSPVFFTLLFFLTIIIITLCLRSVCRWKSCVCSKAAAAGCDYHKNKVCKKLARFIKYKTIFWDLQTQLLFRALMSKCPLLLISYPWVFLFHTAVASAAAVWMWDRPTKWSRNICNNRATSPAFSQKDDFQESIQCDWPSKDFSTLNYEILFYYTI